jgi:hypothetical protein
MSLKPRPPEENIARDPKVLDTLTGDLHVQIVNRVFSRVCVRFVAKRYDYGSEVFLRHIGASDCARPPITKIHVPGNRCGRWARGYFYFFIFRLADRVPWTLMSVA